MVVIEICLSFIVKCFTALVCVNIIDLSFIVTFIAAIKLLQVIQIDPMVLVTLCSVIVAFLTLFWNFYYSRKRDSFHFQHRAKTKNELIDLVSALKSIEFKAEYASNNRRIVMDYSDEKNILLKLRTSRSYYTYMLALDKTQRWWLDIQILVLARSIDSLSPQSIIECVQRILNIFKNNNKVEFVLKKPFGTLMDNLCNLRLTYSNYGRPSVSNGGGNPSDGDGSGPDGEVLPENSGGGNPNNGGGTIGLDGDVLPEDPDGGNPSDGDGSIGPDGEVLPENSGGGNPNNGGGTIGPDGEVLPENPGGDNPNNGVEAVGSDNVVPSENNEVYVFEDFINNLVENVRVNDPDVLLFYGVFKNNVFIVREALDAGANVNCKDSDLKTRYRDNYNEFVRNRNND